MTSAAAEAIEPTEASAKRVYRSAEEGVMRDIIVARLRLSWPGARMIHELPTRYSSNRIDLAAVTRDEIIAVEIKSSRDVADRLEAQIAAFSPIVTRLIVALAPKWNPYPVPLVWTEEKNGARTGRPAYTPAQDAIRRHYAGHIQTWTVSAEAGTSLQTDGHGERPNRTPWVRRMLDILHVAELERVAFEHRISLGRGRHHDLVEACAQHLTGRQAVRATCSALRRRAAFAAGSDAPIDDPRPEA